MLECSDLGSYSMRDCEGLERSTGCPASVCFHLCHHSSTDSSHLKKLLLLSHNLHKYKVMSPVMPSKAHYPKWVWFSTPAFFFKLNSLWLLGLDFTGMRNPSAVVLRRCSECSEIWPLCSLKAIVLCSVLISLYLCRILRNMKDVIFVSLNVCSHRRQKLCSILFTNFVLPASPVMSARVLSTLFKKLQRMEAMFAYRLHWAEIY